jgi:hypothetical protein
MQSPHSLHLSSMMCTIPRETEISLMSRNVRQYFMWVCLYQYHLDSRPQPVPPIPCSDHHRETKTGCCACKIRRCGVPRWHGRAGAILSLLPSSRFPLAPKGKQTSSCIEQELSQIERFPFPSRGWKIEILYLSCSLDSQSSGVPSFRVHWATEGALLKKNFMSSWEQVKRISVSEAAHPET